MRIYLVSLELVWLSCNNDEQPPIDCVAPCAVRRTNAVCQARTWPESTNLYTQSSD